VLTLHSCLLSCFAQIGNKPIYKRLVISTPQSEFDLLMDLMTKIEQNKCPDFYLSPGVGHFRECS
jgi:hypothetical protein